MDIRIGALRGAYDGKPAQRSYGLTVHTDTDPSGVRAAGQRLREVASERELRAAPSGWYYDAGTGVVHVKTAEVSSGEQVTVRIDGAGSVGGTHPQDRAVGLDARTAAIGTIGESQQVDVAVTNSTGKPVTVTGSGLDAPEGWQVAATGPTGTRALPDGDTFTARFTVTPPKGAAPGRYDLSARASYTTRQHSTYSVNTRTATTLAHPSLASAADNVGVTEQDDPGPGDIDGGGSSFIAERLAQKGVTPGAAVKANGFSFTWPDAAPGTPDNVTGKGQTIQVSGDEKGNALAFLGTGTSGSAEGTATVHYTDGTTAEAKLGFPNWAVCPPTGTGRRPRSPRRARTRRPAPPTTPSSTASTPRRCASTRTRTSPPSPCRRTAPCTSSHWTWATRPSCPRRSRTASTPWPTPEATNGSRRPATATPARCGSARPPRRRPRSGTSPGTTKAPTS
ncbi:NEW3 domain-containing protein [Streptomyces sp. CL12-4]|uniref:NEW3 domain-containing protein n=1 Tax=Streptomyces sp. CL12-4 TaxID=2810306 RepID=UPI001EFA5DB9|nr:NEW3 domain-containing protein [Streptomyces sp. CL12-4]